MLQVKVNMFDSIIVRRGVLVEPNDSSWILSAYNE